MMDTRRRFAVVPRLSVLVVGLVAAGCASAPPQRPATPAPAAAPEDRTPESEERIGELEETLEDERRTRAELAQENADLRRRLAQEEAGRASLEERYATLENELAGAVEEVLRSSAASRGVRSRAYATSRIAEVRVQLQAVERPDDPEVSARLEPAHDFLARADLALEEENYGGASYLAERAGELIRRARIVAEIRASSDRAWGNVIPIVPPRKMKALANANLRAGPGLDEQRIGGVLRDDTLLAVARSGEWIQVETGERLKAWIHGRLVKPL